MMASSAYFSIMDVDTEVSILEMGKFSYRVPSFSVLHADLRHIKFQLMTEEGSVLMVDGFIRALEYCFVPVRLCACARTCVCVWCTMVYICVVCMCAHVFVTDILQVEEFCKDHDVSSLTPIGKYGLLVVWQWVDTVADDDDGLCSRSDDNIMNQDGSLSTDSELEDEEHTLTTATFKCIGITRSDSYLKESE